MNDNLPARICPVPPFDDNDKALAGGCLLALLALFLLTSYICAIAKRPAPKPNAERTVTVCSGCGTEWESFDSEPSEPITKCPNCPMSDEEFERLKESVRNRK